MLRVYFVFSNFGQSASGLTLWPKAAFHPVPEYWIDFRLFAPMAVEAACRIARASWAAAVPPAISDRTTTRTHSFLAILPPRFNVWDDSPAHASQFQLLNCSGG